LEKKRSASHHHVQMQMTIQNMQKEVPIANVANKAHHHSGGVHYIGWVHHHGAWFNVQPQIVDLGF